VAPFKWLEAERHAFFLAAAMAAEQNAWNLRPPRRVYLSGGMNVTVARPGASAAPFAAVFAARGTAAHSAAVAPIARHVTIHTSL